MKLWISAVIKQFVTRPDRNASPAIVTLTVTATLNGQTATKDFTLSITPDDAIKAYPGVEGYGAYSKGGRGGQVYHVTNLDGRWRRFFNIWTGTD